VPSREKWPHKGKAGFPAFGTQKSPAREGEIEVMNRYNKLIQRLKTNRPRKILSENLSFSATC